VVKRLIRETNLRRRDLEEKIKTRRRQDGGKSWIK
jgi:hypothetical protein